jgi:hypothetical protein
LLLFAVLLGSIMAVVWLTSHPVSAQAGPSVRETQIQNGFPTELNYSALVDNPEALTEAILFYRVLPEGAITRAPADIVLGDFTRLTASVPTNRGQTYVPAGSDIRWFWQLTSDDGTVTETDEEIFRYEDPRYEWQSIEDGDLTVYYYEQRDLAEDLLASGIEALSEMSALLQVELDFPVRVYMWARPGDAGGVERVESQAFEETVITGGTRVLADLLHVFTPTRWVVRHELTHVLTKLAGEGGIGTIPSWLDEGTATYAEGDWRTRRGGAIAAAVRNDAILNVRGMGSTSNQAGTIDLFYGQSGDMVTFLIDRFGPEQFAQLFNVFKGGSTVENALIETYGFGRDELDTRYRASLNLAPRAVSEDQSTVIDDAPAPPAPTPADQPDDDAAPAADDSTPPVQESVADPVDSAATRSDEEIAARREAITERLQVRRLGPTFESDGGFPWEAVVTGLGGAALLGGALIFWISLGRRDTPAPAGPLIWKQASGPPTSPPVERVTPPSRPARPYGDSSGDSWSGWRKPDDD